MVVNELVSLRIQNKSKVGLFPALFLVSMFLLISCGGGDGETDSDCAKAFNSSTGEWECIGDSSSGSDNESTEIPKSQSFGGGSYKSES